MRIGSWWLLAALLLTSTACDDAASTGALDRGLPVDGAVAPDRGADAAPTPDADPAPEPAADAGPGEDAAQRDAAPPADACVPGTEDCACDAEGACDDGLFCAAGACRVPRCDPGDEGCPCFDDGSCRTGPDGRPMACEGGLCRVTACPDGSEGCACLAFDACDAGLVCQGERCVDPGCDAGALNCICDGDGGCEAGLLCDGGRCVDPGCRLGTLDCACDGGGCDDGLRCAAGACVEACPDGTRGCACDAGRCADGLGCVDDQCVEIGCARGTLGCLCDDLGACRDGDACVDDRCVPRGCAPGEVGCVCLNGRCNAGLECDALDICQGCPSGADGCACRNGACDVGLVCGPDDTCGQPVCEPGAEGCECGFGGECGVNDRGEAMACAGGICVAPSCDPGATGCPCFEGRDCDGANDVCEAGFCQPAGCAPGAANCRCAAGRCGDGLVCRDGVICVDSPGFEGGRCLADERCHPGHRCELDVCVACAPGDPGCSCANGRCRAGARCVDDLCVDPGVLPPDNPLCYSPCAESFEDANGVYRRCDADGLLQGCLDGRRCVQGSCLADGEDLPTCESDVECPDFQTCIAGNCYAECTRDDQCDGGQTCFRKVCRTPCRSGDAENIGCGEDEFCNTRDGDLGHCMPLVPPADVPQFEVTGGIVLDRATLALTNADPVETIVITNEAPTRETVTLRKVAHTVYRADATRDVRRDTEGCDPIRDCPLYWLTIGPPGERAAAPRYEFTLEPGEALTLEIGDADQVAGVRWDGTLALEHPSLNGTRISLGYTETPEGTWSGSIYYFGSFGTADLDLWASLPNPPPDSPPATWTDTKDDAELQERVGNAFVQRWGAFRRGRISWDEFQAVLTATQNESWRWRSVMEDCPEAACYLYQSNRLGLREYSSDLSTVPVPSGIIELPFGANLRLDPDNPGEMIGRIESSNALHYAGNPALTLDFDGDPTTCTRTVGGACMVYVNSMDAQIALGGRYEASADADDCLAHRDGSYQMFATPWLVPGFARNTVLDPETGLRYRRECRDTLLPFQAGIDPEAELAGNLSLTGANPVPDGRARRRSLELVDGALINQTLLFVIFKEKFGSFLDPQGDTDGFEAYGYMILRRNAEPIDDTDANDDDIPDLYQGTLPEDDRIEPRDLLDVECSADLVAEYLDGRRLNAQNAGDFAHALIDGVVQVENARTLNAGSGEQPHYLCVDTGAFDSECAEGSQAIYFTVDSDVISEDELMDLPCNEQGSCLRTLLDWRDDAGSDVLLQYDARWRCADARAVFCSANRFDLRAGKVFYAVGDEESVALPLRPAINDAFRYKTQFRSRQGRNIGFAPRQCLADSDDVPYCYDPPAIEALRARVDCVLHIQESYYDALSDAERGLVDSYLRENFAYVTEPIAPGESIRHDGFERNYAELLVMLGDESITRSFASRFDLAGQNLAAFEGSLFEEDGLDLSGQAGYELYTLHQAAQYYQEALDRFYALGPRIWRSLQFGAEPRNFVTSSTVTWYFDRLVRASTQKTRAWSQIAERYQTFNRPDLARRVVERAYTGAYLESIIMSRMMQRIVGAVAPQEREQIQVILEETQRRYRVALLGMREVYAGISDNQGAFGLAPDFVPIPALDSEDFRQSNGFEVLLRRAQNKAQVARQREDLAIESNRSFDTDSEQFQSELVRIRNTYEDQLAQFCGVFTGDDDIVYPAIAKYGDKSSFTAALGDPCGLVGNGHIHEQAAQFELIGVDLQRLVTQQENVFASVDIERERASAQCQIQFELADFVYEREGEIDNIETAISTGRAAVSRADRALGAISTTANLTKCSVGSTEVVNTCTTAGISTGVFQAAYVGLEASVAVIDGLIIAGERRINDIRRRTARWQTRQQCQAILADSNARMNDMLLRLSELEVEMLRTEYLATLELSQLQQMQQQAKRLQQQQAEAEQLQLNAEAARNDPNIRIYRNDAIINADLSFNDAMREAFRLTRVFEYYTSQSFAGQERLYLIRLVSRGEYNLENYLVDIENAFFDFEEEFGLPDTRVLQVSLRDHILAIPRVDGDGVALSEGERTAQMRAALADPARLDENGYLTLPFSTRLESLSPLTRNHKVRFVEAEIVASDFGADHVGRLYLRQKGTGVVRTLTDAVTYYRLPPRTAVLNPFFNASRFFDNSIYRNQRLRDRPLVNTAWDLVINQRDELANQDINLQSITDIRLFIYYTDFTARF